MQVPFEMACCTYSTDHTSSTVIIKGLWYIIILYNTIYRSMDIHIDIASFVGYERVRCGEIRWFDPFTTYIQYCMYVPAGWSRTVHEC